MIVRENRTTYHCEHCRKILFVQHAMEKHEKACSQNPVNIPRCFDCGQCEHLQRNTKSVWFAHPIYDDPDKGKDVDVKVFHCAALNKDMYPYDVERKGWPEKYPDTYEDQEPMPKECIHFKEFNVF